MLSLYAIQVKLFQELQGLSLFTNNEKKTQRQDYLDWYLFCIWSIWILGETLSMDTVYTSWLRLGCFLAYTSWFVISVTLFCIDDLLSQLGHLFWIHFLNTITVTQVYVLYLNLSQGLYWFLLPCSLVVCNDIGAYICGRCFGQRKLISVSPNKTLEGFIGAWLITMIIGYVFSNWLSQYDYLFLKNAPPITQWLKNTTGNYHHQYHHLEYHSLALAMYASLMAPFGGFFASAVKRAKGVKDFDQWIPGHGGMTDRMDCHLLMGLFTLVYIKALVL
ncbi:unnamed protein product [Absidia cylindrospora]